MYYPVGTFKDAGDGKFVAVSDSSVGGAGNNVFISQTGAAWSVITLTGALGVAGASWQDIDWGGRVFMATTGAFVGQPTSLCMTSPEGEVWTQRTLPLTVSGAMEATRVRYIPSLDMWVTNNNGTECQIPMSVDDGVTWTITNRVDGPTLALVASGIDYSPDHDRWVLCGGNIFSCGLRYSSDNFATHLVNCINSATGLAIPIGIIWRDVRYVPSLRLFVAGHASGWAYSADGITWTLVGTDIVGQPINVFRIAPTPLGLVAASNQAGITSGRDFYSTTNGIDLTRMDLPPVESGVYSRVNFNGFVIGAAGYSDDLNYKNFATAADLPTLGTDWTEYHNVVPGVSVTGLSSRWAWWL